MYGFSRASSGQFADRTFGQSGADEWSPVLSQDRGVALQPGFGSGDSGVLRDGLAERIADLGSNLFEGRVVGDRALDDEIGDLGTGADLGIEAGGHPAEQ